MHLSFPKGFLWGTATSAAQIETAFDHQFKGIRAADGFLFERTIDHERRREEDAALICRLGNLYRCSVDWSRLQAGPLVPFDEAVVGEYTRFFRQLQDNDVQIMFVLNHFAHPRWFEEAGGWLVEDNIEAFVDFARRCHEHFHPFVSHWNTFNEPNVYASMAYLFGEYPPYRRNKLRQAGKVLGNMGWAHNIVYDLIHTRTPHQPVGIAHSVAWFDSRHLLAALPARLCDWWYNYRSVTPFRRSDFLGINYYAYVPFVPLPLTEIKHPGRLAKLGIAHDNMWGYRPEGLARFLRRFHRLSRIPLFVTEGGICTDDPDRRIACIRDQLRICHECLQEGIDLRGYIHWSTFDNFEWTLGPSNRFGLVHVNLFTKERQMTRAGEFYERVVGNNGLDV